MGWLDNWFPAVDDPRTRAKARARNKKAAARKRRRQAKNAAYNKKLDKPGLFR